VWPFTSDQLPRNDIYFFFEKGETWGHGGDRPRIVRVGTHREGTSGHASKTTMYSRNERWISMRSSTATVTFMKYYGISILRHRTPAKPTAPEDPSLSLPSAFLFTGNRKSLSPSGIIIQASPFLTHPGSPQIGQPGSGRNRR
jgi:hypothetical protein